jgi:D-alanyl-D-alanine carboxypeptidase
MGNEPLKAALEFLDSWLAYRMRQVDVPGLCVAIYCKDSIVFSRAYGLANSNRKEAMSTRHLFSAASQTKMFTASAILLLVERGTVQLDDFVGTYLPWISHCQDVRFREITIRQLLSHRAGLIRDGLITDYWEFKAPFPAEADVQKALCGDAIVIEPNRALKYSNLGYALLGQLIEAVSTQPYTTFVTEHIIRPLKLGSTFADYTPALVQRMATGYSMVERRVLAPRRPTQALAAAVGLQTTAEDMVRFAASQFFGTTSLISDRLKKEAQRTQSIITTGRDGGMEFGLGFRIHTPSSRRLIGHDGHLGGHLSVTFFDPDEKIAVAVMANAQDGPSVEIATGIFETLDWFAQHRAAPVPRELARFAVRLHSMTSTVELVATESDVVVIDPDSWSPFAMSEKLTPNDAHTLRITTPDSFLHAGETAVYTFAKDRVESVRYAGLTMVPESGYYKRLPSEK